MSLPRAVLLLNPAARRASSVPIESLLAILGRRWNVEVARPADAAATTRDASAAARAGAAVVIAAGGDGTASDVARGLAGTDVPLALLPLGTANDFARALGVPRTPVAAARRIMASDPRAIDMVSVNGRPFCTVGGIGVVADSAMLAGRLKTSTGLTRRLARAAGGAVYRLTAPYALARRSPLATALEIAWTTPGGDAREMRLESPGVFVANQRYCGGGLTLPGVTADDDGIFELLVIRDVSRVRLLEAFSRLSLRLPIAERVLMTIPAQRARITCSRDEIFLGDGDSLGTRRDFDLKAMPRALRVLA